MMFKLLTRRPWFREFTTLGLSGVLAIFSIGIPIIVASCPMEKAPGKVYCAMCHQENVPGKTSIAIERNGSCCRTIIGSGRNLTEFLPKESYHSEQIQIQDILPVCLLLPSPAGSGTAGGSLSEESISVPFTRDIPLLHSSLLI